MELRVEIFLESSEILLLILKLGSQVILSDFELLFQQLHFFLIFCKLCLQQRGYSRGRLSVLVQISLMLLPTSIHLQLLDFSLEFLIILLKQADRFVNRHVILPFL